MDRWSSDQAVTPPPGAYCTDSGWQMTSPVQDGSSCMQNVLALLLYNRGRWRCVLRLYVSSINFERSERGSLLRLETGVNRWVKKKAAVRVMFATNRKVKMVSFSHDDDLLPNITE